MPRPTHPPKVAREAAKPTSDPDQPHRALLTDFAVKNLKSKAKRYTIWDTRYPGFGVRVSTNGVKSFFVFRRMPKAKNAVRITLGRYPKEPGAHGVTLAKAREAAREALGLLADGINPSDVDEERRQDEAKRRADTFASVAEDFIKLHVARRLRKARAAEARIRHEFLGQERRQRKDENGKVVEEWVPGREPRWREKPITSIRRRDAIALLEEIVHQRSLSPARKVHAAGSKLFKWAIERDQYGLDQNPFSLINFKDQFGTIDPRDRILSDDELRSVWNVAKSFKYPFGDIVRGLTLTGQRLREIASAQWNEIDFDKALLVVPKERMKGKHTHTVPLTPAMVTLLQDVPRFEAPKPQDDDSEAPAIGPFVFSTRDGHRPVSGFSKMKASFDKAMAAQRKEDGLPAMRPWVLHDLRRTVRTRLSELRVLPEFAERVLAHTPPKSGVRRTYDLHTFDQEKREALDRWETVLLAIVEPKPTAPNVVTLERKERA